MARTKALSRFDDPNHYVEGWTFPSGRASREREFLLAIKTYDWTVEAAARAYGIDAKRAKDILAARKAEGSPLQTANPADDPTRPGDQDVVSKRARDFTP